MRKLFLMLFLIGAGITFFCSGCTTNNYHGPVRNSDPWAFDSRVESGQSYKRVVSKNGSRIPGDACYRQEFYRILVD